MIKFIKNLGKNECIHNRISANYSDVVKKFRNSKIADKDEVTGKIMKNGNELVIC